MDRYKYLLRIYISCYTRTNCFWVGYVLVALISPFSSQGQSRTFTVGARLGIITFRDPTASAFRYAMPTGGLSVERLRLINNRSKSLIFIVDWGQQRTPGRFFQRVLEWTIGYQSLYKLSPAFQLGWQSRFRFHVHYDRLEFTTSGNQSIGGNLLLEAAPVGTYSRNLSLFGHPFRFGEQLAIPLLTVALAGSYGASEPYVGLAWPNVTNTLSLQTNTSNKRIWKIAYQWSYTRVGVRTTYQQQAYNGLSISTSL